MSALQVVAPDETARAVAALELAGCPLRTCRAALAALEPEEAMADLDRQHAQRSARVAQRPDGMTHLAVDDPDARHGLPVFLVQLPAERLLPPDEVERLRAGTGTDRHRPVRRPDRTSPARTTGRTGRSTAGPTGRARRRRPTAHVGVRWVDERTSPDVGGHCGG